MNKKINLLIITAGLLFSFSCEEKFKKTSKNDEMHKSAPRLASVAFTSETTSNIVSKGGRAKKPLCCVGAPSRFKKCSFN